MQAKQLSNMPPVSRQEMADISQFMEDLRLYLNTKTLEMSFRDLALDNFEIISRRLRGQEIRVRGQIEQGIDPATIPEHVLTHREWQELCQRVDSTIKRLMRAKNISA